MTSGVIGPGLIALTVAVMFVLIVPVAVGEITPSTLDQARQLVRDLGASDFRTREQASAGLPLLGIDAVTTLAEVEQSPDPEVRVRARELLLDLRSGIGPDWPQALVTTVRNFPKLPASERPVIIGVVAGELKVKAIPFLVRCLTAGAPDECKEAVQLIQGMQPAEQTAQLVLLWLKQTATPSQRRVRGWALGISGQPLEGLRVLGEQPPDDPTRHHLVEQAIQDLLSRIKRQPLVAAAAASALANLVPDDARILHLEGMALEASGHKDEARRLLDQALALSPESKEPHAVAAKFLEGQKQYGIAKLEWQLYLKIPPRDLVGEGTANLHLGTILAEFHKFAEAADAYEQALELYHKSKAAGNLIKFTDGDEPKLVATIAEMRRLAASAETPEINLVLTPLLKDCNAKKWGELTKNVQAEVSVKVQPAGFRLFDWPGAGMAFDVVKNQLVPEFNGQRAGETIGFIPVGNPARIMVISEGCYYFYEIDTVTGMARKLDRVEKNYRVKLLPGPRARALHDVTVTLNGKTNDWEQLQQGVVIDSLPETLEVVAHGLTTNQTWETIREKAPVIEPPLKPTPSQ